MRARTLAAGGVVVAAVCAAPAVGAFDAGEVTIRARAVFDPGTRTRELDISGTVATRAAGETVDVLAKECGPYHQFYRVVGGAKTAEGGSWQLVTELGGVDLVQLPGNAYFRARWRGFRSEPVLVRVPMFVSASWNPRRRIATVSVSTSMSGQNVRRRYVELQRQVEGTQQWVRVRRARLSRSTRAPGLFQATFAVPTRGLTLRGFAPEATGAPCFSPAASPPFGS